MAKLKATSRTKAEIRTRGCQVAIRLAATRWPHTLRAIAQKSAPVLTGWGHFDAAGRKEKGLRGVSFFVTSCSRICLYRKKINLSKSLAGQAVGVKEADDGIWLVSLMNYDLGYIDLEERTLQPLENPFRPKVLPMS